MRCLVPAALLAAASLGLILPDGMTAADPPAPADKDGWTDLLAEAGPSTWRKVDDRWIKAGDAALHPDKPTRLTAKGAGTAVWVNGEGGRVADLLTKQDYTDVEIHVEFLLGKNSNSGIKFCGLYEIQFRDTADAKGPLSGDSCGGIYPMALAWPYYRHLDAGIAPRVNAARPAGEWQTLDASFRAPRFENGAKTERAKVVKAVLNGRVIHENVAMKYPTGANWEAKEVPAGPFMLQADHGPVAFRNVRIRPLK